MGNNIESSVSQLAIAGGSPVIPEGPPSWPTADDEVRLALEAAYADGSWGRYEGPHCGRLADLLSQMHCTEHVMLCSSGTIAVEIALRGLGIGADDEVILAGYDFSGNFRCIEAIGARPVLVDIDPATWCLDIEQVEEAIGESTSAIIVSHLHGGLADMRRLCELARQRGLAVVEDACQVPGATVQGKVAGTHGDVGVLSFGGSKLLTAGRGGAIVTHRADVHQRAKIFSQRGNQAFPLSELQAAVLPPQIEKLEKRNDQRHNSVDRLLQGCANLNALYPLENHVIDSQTAYYKLPWLYDESQCGNRSREEFIATVRAEGVAIDAGFRGFTRRSAARCRKVGSLEHSSKAAEATLLLHHPVLLKSDETIDRVATALIKVTAALAHKEG